MRLENVTKGLESIVVGLGGRQDWVEGRPLWILDFDGDQQLASLSARLSSEGVLFAGGLAGWPPAAIFEDLRDKGLLQGSFKEVTWTGPGKWVVRER